MSEANFWLNIWLLLWGLAAIWVIIKVFVGDSRE